MCYSVMPSFCVSNIQVPGNLQNPFRTGIAETVLTLRVYPFAGHWSLMGKRDILWQDTAYVLALFGKTVTDERQS